MEIATKHQEIYQSYSSLPKRVQESHREMSLRALLDSDRARMRETLDGNAALHILAQNYTPGPVQLNRQAFTYSTANYRHGYICELLRRLGLEVKGCATEKAVSAALNQSGLEFRDAEAMLADLVTRRNEVAHSYQMPALLEVDVLKAYVEVISVYLSGLIAAASKQLLRQLAGEQLVKLGCIAHCWSQALGLVMENGRIKAPCSVLLVKESRVSVIVVETLECDNVGVIEPVEFRGQIINLGLGVAGGAPSDVNSADAFVLPDKWHGLVGWGA